MEIKEGSSLLPCPPRAAGDKEFPLGSPEGLLVSTPRIPPCPDPPLHCCWGLQETGGQGREPCPRAQAQLSASSGGVKGSDCPVRGISSALEALEDFSGVCTSGTLREDAATVDPVPSVTTYRQSPLRPAVHPSPWSGTQSLAVCLGATLGSSELRGWGDRVKEGVPGSAVGSVTLCIPGFCSWPAAHQGRGSGGCASTWVYAHVGV